MMMKDNKIELTEPNVGFGSSIFTTIYNESVTESTQNHKDQPISVSPPMTIFPMIKIFSLIMSPSQSLSMSLMFLKTIPSKTTSFI